MNTTFENWKKELETDSRHAQQDSVRLFVMGGGSFVGKTTATKTLLRYGILATSPVLLDAKLIRTFCDNMQPSTSERHPEKSEENYLNYVKARDAAVLHCLEHGYSVVLDEHCDDVNNIKPLMDKVHAMDHVQQTSLIGQCVELGTYMKRIRRFSKEEQAFGVKTSQQFFNNIDTLLTLFDQSVIIDGGVKNKRAAEPIISGYSDDGEFICSTFDPEAYMRAKTILDAPYIGSYASASETPAQTPQNVPTSKIEMPYANYRGTLAGVTCQVLNEGQLHLVKGAARLR